jgi:beta-mannosidase
MINKTNWMINNTLYLETVNTKQTAVHLEIALSNNILYSSNITFNPLSDGTAHINLPISVNNTINIDPWFPNGVSNGNQTLYSYKVSIITESGNYSKNVKIGFRTIQLIEEPIDPIGSTFYFKVNGIRFFAKGSNWVPAHVFPELLTTDYLRNLLQSAKDANMNMLRVWGGGLYESDEFYQIADELGILIWQDFMFACSTYPTDEEFLSSVTTEVTQQVRRLQYHPSIAIWAGLSI